VLLLLLFEMTTLMTTLSRFDFLPGVAESSAKYKDGCPRCGHAVFEAEKLIAAKRVNATTKGGVIVVNDINNKSSSQSWHRRCFACGTCGQHLDSTKVNDGPDNNIYCKPCYGAKFGMRGYGFGMGAGCLTMVSLGISH
jgi:hypothetical protein